MIFEDHCKIKMIAGEQQYGKDTWQKLSVNTLLNEAKDELVDCFNYLTMIEYIDKNMEINWKFASLKVQIRNIYCMLDKLKC
ncbi:MAG: hypothetical protein KKC77_19365 [Proteobacteria bacterium]|nr:hypothetical protein [Pseudomonadota bacterium]